MTVYIETIRTIGLQIKGEVKKIDQVKKIIEENNRLVLWHGENWQTYISKDTYRIVHIN